MNNDDGSFPRMPNPAAPLLAAARSRPLPPSSEGPPAQSSADVGLS